MRVGNPAPDDGLGGLVKDGVKFTLGGFRKDPAQEDEPEGLEGLVLLRAVLPEACLLYTSPSPRDRG